MSDEAELTPEEAKEELFLFEQLGDSFRSMYADIQPAVATWLTECAGDKLNDMLTNPACTKKYLSNPNPDLRKASLHLLITHWNISDQIKADCEQMVQTDPDLSVRKVAIDALASSYSGTEDTRIGSILANIALCSTEPESIRISAYRALVFINGLIRYRGASLFSLESAHQFDMELINRYSSSPQKSE